MKTLALSCAAVVALQFAHHASAAGEEWTSDFAAAKKEAAETGKDLLVDFTGSDWCGWCIKLDKEVFQHDAFRNGVKDTFVLVELDFPWNKKNLTEETRKQNAELGTRYGVTGYPTVLICDAEGLPYHKTGYAVGGPESYVENLNVARRKKPARDEAFAKAEKAEGKEKAEMLIAALEALHLNEATMALSYGDVIQQIQAADPDDATGFLKKILPAKRQGEYRLELTQLKNLNNPAAVLEFINGTLAKGGREPGELVPIFFDRMLVLEELGKFAEAIQSLDDAAAAQPDHPLIARTAAFRKQLQTKLDKQQEKPAGETKPDSGS